MENWISLNAQSSKSKCDWCSALHSWPSRLQIQKGRKHLNQICSFKDLIGVIIVIHFSLHVRIHISVFMENSEVNIFKVYMCMKLSTKSGIALTGNKCAHNYFDGFVGHFAYVIEIWHLSSQQSRQISCIWLIGFMIVHSREQLMNKHKTCNHLQKFWKTPHKKNWFCSLSNTY